jgi:hypothetical protein
MAAPAIHPCFFCCSKEPVANVLSLRELKHLPAALEPYRNTGFAICEECWNRGPEHIADQLAQYLREISVIVN